MQPTIQVGLPDRVAIINPSRVPEQESLFLAQNIPLPTLEQLGNQSPVTIIAFVVLSALFVVGLVVSLVGGGGFFFLRGMLQVLQTQQTTIQNQQNALKTQQDRDEEDRKRQDAIRSDMTVLKSDVASGLQQLQSTNATKTGQIRSEAADKQLTETISGSTERMINALAAIPNATNEPVVPLLKEIISIVERIDGKEISPDTLKTELAQLKINFDKTLQEYLSRDARSNRALDANDVTIDAARVLHDADAAQHTKDVATITALSPVDGELNRHIIDGDVDKEHAA